MLATDLHNNATASSYCSQMRAKPPPTRKILADNLKRLMERRDWKQKALEKASGVSQRHISSLLNEKQDCTLPILSALGHAFGRPAWLLLIPDLPSDLMDSQEIPLLIEHFIGSDPDGRDTLNKLAAREYRLNPAREKVVPLKKPNTG